MANDLMEVKEVKEKTCWLRTGAHKPEIWPDYQNTGTAALQGDK